MPSGLCMLGDSILAVAFPQNDLEDRMEEDGKIRSGEDGLT